MQDIVHAAAYWRNSEVSTANNSVNTCGFIGTGDKINLLGHDQ